MHVKPCQARNMHEVCHAPFYQTHYWGVACIHTELVVIAYIRHRWASPAASGDKHLVELHQG